MDRGDNRNRIQSDSANINKSISNKLFSRRNNANMFYAGFMGTHFFNGR